VQHCLAWTRKRFLVVRSKSHFLDQLTKQGKPFRAAIYPQHKIDILGRFLTSEETPEAKYLNHIEWQFLERGRFAKFNKSFLKDYSTRYWHDRGAHGGSVLDNCSEYYGGDHRRFMPSFGDSQPAIGWVVLAERILLRETIGKWHGFSR